MIKEKYRALKENYTPVNVIKYMEYIRSLPENKVLENSQYVFSEPIKGAEFILELFKKNELTPTEIETQIKKVSSYLKKNSVDEEHKSILEECITTLQEQYNYKSTDEYLIKNTIQVLENRLRQINNIIVREGNETIEEHIGTMAPDIIYAEGDLDSEEIQLMKKRAETNFAINFVKTFMDDSDEVNLESFNAMLRSGFEFDKLVEMEEEIEGVTEAYKERSRKLALAADRGARKVASSLKKAHSERHRVKNIKKRIPQHFDRLIDNTLGRLSEMDRQERRKRILEGGYRRKLLKLIRNGILLGVGWAVNPAIAAIGMLGYLLTDKQVDDKVRKEVIRDLELELKMTREKIKDAESRGDNKKKYQLMRIENAIERDIQRVKSRSNTVRVSGRGVRI